MRKEFNITGSCNPQWHYMVDTEKRFKAIESLIDRGKYFAINRARQYGKTADSVVCGKEDKLVMKKLYLILFAVSFSLLALAQEKYELGKPNDDNYRYLDQYHALKDYIDYSKYPNFKLGIGIHRDILCCKTPSR